MIKITIAAALLTASLSGAAQAGQHSIYTDADRAFTSDYQASDRAPAQAPRQQYYQGGFGSFGGAAGMAHTLGY